MSNLVQRTLSGAVYVAVVVAAILLIKEGAFLFPILATLATLEYHRLMKSPSGVVGWSVAMLCGLYAVTVAGDLVWSHVAFGLIVMFGLCAELFRKAENPMRNWGNMLISLVMIGFPFTCVQRILALGEWEVMRYVLLSVFVCIWVNDSGAYCVGSLIGKHKMFPRVSPGKSWEGLVGGFAFSLLTGYVFSLFVADYSAWQWILIALTVSVFGTFGDLMESLLKRTIGVKDSGKFMPGHGGVLDRFDSLLFALPAVWLLLQIFITL